MADETPTPTEPDEGGDVTEETPPEIGDPAALLRNNEKFRHENISLRRQLDEAAAQIEESRKAQMDEHERALEDAVARGKAEAEAEYAPKLRVYKVTARAAGVLADPDDAARMLDLSELDPDDNEAVDAAIAALIKAKPYLAARRTSRIDQGPQGTLPDSGDTGDDWLRRVAGRA